MAVGMPDRAAAQTENNEAAPRPNILLIVSDDMGWGQPGFNGGTEVLTPNMDRIAGEGIKLTQFYVQPQCAPSRASLLTGRYPWKNGVGTNPHPETNAGMLLDERTVAQALGDADYSTWIVGKWHLGHWRREHLPLQRGFDHHYGMYTGQLRSFTHTRAAASRLVLDWHRNGRPVVESGYSTFLLAEEAVQLIGRHDGSSPFFLYLPFNAVHTPFQAPQEYRDLFSGSHSKQRAMLKAMDDAIGWVLAALERKGVLDDTLVMFMGDNGDAPGVGTPGPYRGKKATYFEGGIRAPAVLRWPSEIPAGSESDALLHAVDLFPTFAGLAGASTTGGQPLDGLDAWAAIAHGAESPRTELVYSPHVIRMGDWKLIEAIAHTTRWVARTLQLYNIAEDPYETTNLAATETAKVAELEARLDHHAQFARYTAPGEQISDSPLVVFGAEENEVFGTAVQTALTERESGNTGPTLVRLEAVGDQVKLSFDEPLDAGAVPPASAFTVVVNPGYKAADVEEVSVSGRAVRLTLKEALASTDTVGLTYEVPDTGAIRDLDDLEAVGVTWITGAVTSGFLSGDATLSALSLSGIEIGTFWSTVTSYSAEVGNGIDRTTVTATASHPQAEVSITPGAEVSLAQGANQITVTVTAEDGTTTQAYTVTVTRTGMPEVSIAAVSSSVTEGAAAAFEVRLAEAAVEALTVAVSVTETGSMLSGTPPASVVLSTGDTGATLSVPTAGDSVVEEDSTVAATLAAGTGYSVGTASSATVTVEDDDEATFTVGVAPAEIDEGDSATLTVAISNGVTFAEDQAISLSTSGTASASDYTGVPPTLTLAAGASSGTATLVAAADQQEEADETVIVAATHRGTSIGSATVTIHSISHDATLGSLSLSGIEIGTFSGAVTSYQASVGHAVATTTVTAAAKHSGAWVSIEPGSEVNLAVGANAIAVTVTAEDGTTTKTYTVTVTRAEERVLPEVSVAAVSERLTGPIGEFTVSRTGPTAEPLEVQALFATSRGERARTVTFQIPRGKSSVTRRVQVGDNKLVEDAITVTWTLLEDEGYTVSADHASASLVLEESDTAEFEVSVEPAEIAEGESATVTVATTNGVRFGEDQTIALSVSGTASGSDYMGMPARLTLPAYGTSATATLTAAADDEEEDAETVTVTASHGGSAIGSATVSINSISHDATLGALSLSSVDVGTFSAAVTSYQASVANSVTATTVTATATHPAASVSIKPGSAVTLAEGENEIAVTVTAEDGTTTKTYTVTVTRVALPVATVSASASPVAEGTAATFTVTLDETAREALTVAVSVTESGSALSGTPPASVAFSEGEASATLSVPTAGDSVVEADSTVTASVTAGTGYAVGTPSAAVVTVEDDDAATFTVSADPAAIEEGESATLTVAISNGVTFAEDQAISLATSGTASASDYTGVPPTLTLAAGAASVAATLAAAADQQEEADETVTVTATHAGTSIGSATVTIHSISHDATLGGLSLSGIEIGTFSAAVTSYRASVANSVTATTVTATATHPAATVSIKPGSAVTLAEGENAIAVTVTAEDGTTTKTYTVTVTRAALPVVSIAAVKERVRGPIGAVRATRSGPTAEPLEVQVHMTNSRASKVQTLTFRFPRGQSSLTRRVQAGDNKLVEDDITVTWTLQEGEGYAVSAEQASASVVLEESDIPAFAVSAEPAEIAEGESATVTVATTNGVRFREAQTIALSVSGTASGSDYTGVPATLTLPAYRTSTAATLTAVADQAEEADETVTITASHGGAEIGSATVTVTASEAAPAGGGFPLAPENSRPSGIWSDGETAWVADLNDARLYAYQRTDGERQPGKDIATEPAPMGLWSDGETLWVAGLGGGLRAHRLADGTRLAARDLAVEANTAPAGVWSDGEMAWVADWLGDTVHAYRLADGRRVADREIKLDGGNLLPVGLWSDGETLWVADWRERLYAYRLTDGGRDPRRDIEAGAGDTDPTGLWSVNGTLLSTGWEDGQVRAYMLPELLSPGPAPAKSDSVGLPARATSLPGIADSALRAAIDAALGKAPGEAVGLEELARLESLQGRNAGIRDLSGLEQAISLKELDLGFNPLADLGVLATLPALESLNLDGAATDLRALVPLARLQRLSLRHNDLDDLWPLAGLASLTELDVGGNRIEDLSPLAGLTGLAVLRADRNRIADLWPLAALAELEVLDLGTNRVRDLQPLASLARLEALQLDSNGLRGLHALAGLRALRELGLAGNAVENLGALSSLARLQRLDLRGSLVDDLRPLHALPSLAWVHVGGSGIEDLAPLDGLPGLTMAGAEDREPPSVSGEGDSDASRH